MSTKRKREESSPNNHTRKRKIPKEELLRYFSLEHLTFINQIFGDISVREIIEEVFKDERRQRLQARDKPEENFRFKLVVEKNVGSMYDGRTAHHLLVKVQDDQEIDGWKDRNLLQSYPKSRFQRICSANSVNGCQDIAININDTLCQSYSLLTFMGREEELAPDEKPGLDTESMKKRQRTMTEMYRYMISNPEFVKSLDDVIHDKNLGLWKDFRKGPKTILPMNKDAILRKISTVLHKWDEYGFYYFIGKGDGKCPRVKKVKVVRKRQSLPQQTPVRLSVPRSYYSSLSPRPYRVSLSPKRPTKKPRTSSTKEEE